MVARLALLLFAGALAFAQPKRIVSTAPSITEMLYALGLGDRVVGVTTFCHYPPEATRKPKIGNYLRPDTEAIVALRPDAVIAERSMIRRSIDLPTLRLNVVEVDDATIPGVYASIRRIGELAGVAGRAEALCVSIRGNLETVRRRTAQLPHPRVLFVVGRTPGKIEDLIVAGGASYLNEVLEIAGGANILLDAHTSYAKVSLEEVLARNPEVIIDMGEMSQTIGVTARDRRRVVELWRRYPSLAAVRGKRVYAVASDIYVVPGPRVVEAAREFARMLHGE